MSVPERSLIPDNHLPGKRKKKRKPDPIWDVVCELWYPDGVDKYIRKKVGVEVSRYKFLKATSEDIREGRENYMASPKMQGCICTAQALLNRWTEFKPGGTEVPKRTVTPGSSPVEPMTAKEHNGLLRERIAHELFETIPEDKRRMAWSKYLNSLPPRMRKVFGAFGSRRFQTMVVLGTMADELDRQWKVHPEYRA